MRGENKIDYNAFLRAYRKVSSNKENAHICQTLHKEDNRNPANYKFLTYLFWDAKTKVTRVLQDQAL